MVGLLGWHWHLFERHRVAAVRTLARRVGASGRLERLSCGSPAVPRVLRPNLPGKGLGGSTSIRFSDIFAIIGILRWASAVHGSRDECKLLSVSGRYPYADRHVDGLSLVRRSAEPDDTVGSNDHL